MSKNAGRIISIDGISGTGKSQIMRHLMGYYDKYNAYKVAGFSENLISPERVGLAKKIDAIRSDLSLSDSKKTLKKTKSLLKLPQMTERISQELSFHLFSKLVLISFFLIVGIQPIWPINP